jgi:hypothetical protein
VEIDRQRIHLRQRSVSTSRPEASEFLFISEAMQQ